MKYEKNGLDEESVSPTKAIISDGPYRHTYVIFRETFSLRELIFIGCLIVSVLACFILIPFAVRSNNGDISDSTAQCLTGDCLEASTSLVFSMNTSVDPCDDFYKYACGMWKKRHPLDSNQAERTVPSIMYESHEFRLKKKLEGGPGQNSSWKTLEQFKTFYTSCKDDFQRQRNGGKDFMNNVINNIGGWYILDPNVTKSWDLNRNFRKTYIDFWTKALFGISLKPKASDPEKYIIEIGHGGVGLDYLAYDAKAEKSEKYNAYEKYVINIGKKMVRDSGVVIKEEEMKKRIGEFSSDVMKVESSLAGFEKSTKTSTNEEMTIAELSSISGDLINFSDFLPALFEEANVKSTTMVRLYNRAYLANVFEMLRNFSTTPHLLERKMNNYFVWRLAHHFAPYLSYEYMYAKSELHEILTGSTEFPPIWQQCINHMIMYLNYGMNAIFISHEDSHFGKKEKEEKQIQKIVSQTKEDLKLQIDTLQWMDTETKFLAKNKLDHTEVKIGFPDEMTDKTHVDGFYEELNVTKDNLLQNLINVFKYDKKDLTKRLITGEDRSRWRVNTFSVRADFSEEWNEILIPAGLLQGPLYHSDLPHFMTLGTIGTKIASALIFAVDETGGLFGIDGHFGDWWSPQTRQDFRDTVTCISNYYSGQKAGPYHIPGYGTDIMINIRGNYFSKYGQSDIGGVRLAYKLWQDDKNPSTSKALPGVNFSDDQLFFLSFAQSECFHRRDEEAIEIINFGGAPEDVRVNAALAQLEEFQDAFKCPVDSKMTTPKAKKCNSF